MRQKLTRTAVLILALLGCLLPGGSLFAQSRTITGTVTSGGIGISGVTVLLRGAKTATQTDALGRFTIKVDNVQGAFLTFTSVGYTSQEMPIETVTNVNVTMIESDRILSEVVVTALGIKKEAKRIGYATQEVKGAELIKARDPNAINQLEGKVAGLDIGSSPEMYGRPT
jgi:hypothetical protein